MRNRGIWIATDGSQNTVGVLVGVVDCALVRSSESWIEVLAVRMRMKL
jgi:hypothetical protein